MIFIILLILLAVGIGVVVYVAVASKLEDKKKSENGLKLASNSFGHYSDKLEYMLGKYILYDEHNHRLFLGDETIDDRLIMKMETQANNPEVYVSSTKKEFKTTTDTGSMLGRSIAGGLIAGPLGAIIGGATASKTTEIVEKPKYSLTTGQYFITLYDGQDKFCGMIGTNEKKRYDAAVQFFSTIINKNQERARLEAQEAQVDSLIAEQVTEPEIVPEQETTMEQPVLHQENSVEQVVEETDYHEEEKPETAPVLTRINQRDALPLFVFPESALVKELSGIRDEGLKKGGCRLPIILGQKDNNNVELIDLANLPNLLIAGSRACYESIVQSLKTIIYSLLLTRHPSEVKFVLLDAHRLDFMGYERLLYHYLACLPGSNNEKDEIKNSVISSSRDAYHIISSIRKEIDTRIELIQRARCRSIEQYNEKFLNRELLPSEGHRYIPYIVVMMNEYSELISTEPHSKRAFLNSLVHLGRLGKSAGIHLVLGTTCILKDYLTKELLDVCPGIMAFRVNSRLDSKMLLDEFGAEVQPDSFSFVYKENGETSPLRCLDIPVDEFDRVVDEIGDQKGPKKSFRTGYYLCDPNEPEEDEGGGMIDMKDIDEHFEEAARLVVTSQRGSTSDLQRRLGLGYAKACRVMDQLEAAGIVGPQQGSMPREVLVKDFIELDAILTRFFKQ